MRMHQLQDPPSHTYVYTHIYIPRWARVNCSFSLLFLAAALMNVFQSTTPPISTFTGSHQGTHVGLAQIPQGVMGKSTAAACARSIPVVC